MFVFDVVKKQKVFPVADRISRIIKVKFVKNKQFIKKTEMQILANKNSAKSYIACFGIADTPKF